MPSKYCTFEDEVKIDEFTFKIQICVTAPNGQVVDEHMSRRVIGEFKRILDADFEAERE